MATAVDHLNHFHICSLLICIYGKYVNILSMSTAVAISKFADKYENNADKKLKNAEDIKGYVWWKLSCQLQELFYQNDFFYVVIYLYL